MCPSVIENAGYRLIIESNSALRTAAIGVWFENGTRYENDQQTGYAHLLEHLLFKGTRQYTAHDLSARFESMGGQINAETGRELTAVHGVVPANHAAELLTLILQMLTDFDFSEQDFYLERDVVLQELAMLDDDPEEALEDFSTEQVWYPHSMGRQILGTRESLANVGYAEFVTYMRDTLNAARFTIVAVGQINGTEIASTCQQLEGKSTTRYSVSTPCYQTTSTHFDIESQQQHLLWVMPAIRYGHQDIAVYDIANHILAGGYDSRLYQALREKLGLVYSIDSRCDYYADTGLWFIQTNTDNQNIERTREATIQTINELSISGPSMAEIENAKCHLQARLTLEADDIGSRMESIAHDIMYCGRVRSLQEQINAYQSINSKDVASVLQRAWENHSFFTAH